jgi:hypothetical protein
MKRLKNTTLVLLLLQLFMLAGVKAQTPKKPEPQTAVQTQAANNPVNGSGTVGRLARWTGVDGSNSY